MKKKEIAAVIAAMMIFLFVGCNYNRFLPSDITSMEHVSTVQADGITVMPTEAYATAPFAAVEQTTLKQYDFTRLIYSLNSTAVACFDVRENRYLYEKNTQSRIAPASLTKIVTACVALKYADPSSVYTVGDEILLVGENSSLCYINQGQQATLYDLLCGMLLVSGNDAAYTIAVNIARTVSGNSLSAAEGAVYFVGLMNDFGAGIGLTDSHFANPDGWDDDGHYMCLRDIVTAARYAIGLDVFREIVGKTSYSASFVSGQTVEWNNINQMQNTDSAFYVEHVKGIKTGNTQNAGRCLIALYEDGSHELIAASMGNPTNEERYFSVREMIDTVLLQ